MTVAISYVYPNILASKYDPAARRFVSTYQQFPPGWDVSQFFVIGNGPPLSGYQRALFNPMAAQHYTHNNFGKDIGAFQMIAGRVKCDLMLFFGAHIYFWRAGWLARMIQAYLDNGPGLYGTWAFHQPRPHIRTTAFACAPELLDTYPLVVHDSSRYAFEHGENSLTLWAQRSGFATNMVTWDGCYPMEQWKHVSRQESLFYDQWFDDRGGP